MKLSILNTSLFASLLFLIMVGLPGINCSKDYKSKAQYSASGNANGTQVAPSTAASATGSIAGTYVSNDNTLIGTISWSGLSGPPTAIHLHGPAAPGRNNIILFNYTNFPVTASGTFNFTSVFTHSQEGWLLGNKLYFDIHTAAYPNGEIRGQVILQ